MRSVLKMLLPVLPISVSVWSLVITTVHLLLLKCSPTLERGETTDTGQCTASQQHPTIIKSKISLGKNCIILTFSEQTFILRNIMTFIVARFNPA